MVLDKLIGMLVLILLVVGGSVLIALGPKIVQNTLKSTLVLANPDSALYKTFVNNFETV